MESATPKLNAKSILKSLPAGFAGVSIPKKTRIVFLRANANAISKDDAHNAVKSICKTYGLSIENEYSNEEIYECKLVDVAFNKQMRLDAKACLKIVKSFYSKYKNSFMYDDNACETVRQINYVVCND